MKLLPNFFFKASTDTYKPLCCYMCKKKILPKNTIYVFNSNFYCSEKCRKKNVSFSEFF